MRSVEDKVVVITGASRGIGSGIARIFAGDKARLVLCGRNRKALSETVQSLEIDRSRIKTVIADIRKASGMRKIVEAAYAKFGVVDIFINNAGVGIHKPLMDMTESEFDQIMETNLKAVFHSFKEMLPRMIDQGFGQIINISSGVARIGQAGLSAYAASKAALNVFSEAVANEVRNQNVKISVLSPASTDTNFMSNMSARSKTPSRASKKLTIDEVAEAVLFLARQNENAWTSLADIRPLSIRK